MRSDMAKVVTERPRAGHGRPSAKWGRRLGKHEHDADDHGPMRAPIARRRQYGWDAKTFSDLLGPLRRYLRAQVGRPWDAVWSEISRTLDNRSLSGQHIFDHIRWEVAQFTSVGVDGRVYQEFRAGRVPVGGLYVHPATRLLCHAPEPWRRHRGIGIWKAQATLRTFGIEASTAADVRRFRVDGMRVWERRDCGWFVHAYRFVPPQVVRVVTRSDGREVPVYGAPRYERAATRQAGKKEIRAARPILNRDPIPASARTSDSR